MNHSRGYLHCPPRSNACPPTCCSWDHQASSPLGSTPSMQRRLGPPSRGVDLHSDHAIIGPSVDFFWIRGSPQPPRRLEGACGHLRPNPSGPAPPVGSSSCVAHRMACGLPLDFLLVLEKTIASRRVIEVFSPCFGFPKGISTCCSEAIASGDDPRSTDHSPHLPTGSSGIVGFQAMKAGYGCRFPRHHVKGARQVADWIDH
jgi:hypothetical protein